MAFFTQGYTKPEQIQTEGFIYVGPDLFCATAVALIDTLKQGAKFDDASLKKITEGFTTHYPKLLSFQPYAKDRERFEALINSKDKMSETVKSLAFVLRKLAVYVVKADPLKYQDVLLPFSSEHTLADLCNPDTQLPIKALEALTEALGIKFKLSIVEHNKEIRRLKEYPELLDEKARIELTLQVKTDVAFPKIKDKKAYAHVAYAHTKTLPQNTLELETQTIAPLLDEITLSNKQIGIVYEQNRRTLLSMTSVGQVSNEQLIALFQMYNQELSNNESLTEKSITPVAEVSEEEPVPQITRLLINAFSELISTKKIDGDEFYEHIAPVKQQPRI